MPIYEYKCPNGHHFEVFHGMSETGPTKCQECGASPMVRVLHPVAVHYKGSGFYSTDYGKGKKSGGGSGNSGGESSSGSSGESGGGGGESGGSGIKDPQGAPYTKGGGDSSSSSNS